MRSWDIFSRNVFRLFAGRSFAKLSRNSIESVLRRSVSFLDPQTTDEIKAFIKRHQTISGGFADRAGNCDLYYSLFGCYIAEALGFDEIKPLLKEYVKKEIMTGKLTGIHQKCAVILHAKLFNNKALPPSLLKDESVTAQYSDFINMLSSYYSNDYLSLYKSIRRLSRTGTGNNQPCSVIAAHLILRECSESNPEDPWKQMKSFYKNGSFSAFRNAPSGDLLSTGVALYALRFAESELKLIKPESLMFIDSLYSEGGFCATDLDPGPDVEYTFYGLLALGSLSD